MASNELTVTELLNLDCDSLSYDQKLDIKQRGRPTPQITFDGKRQCRLSEHYERWKWMCGCPDRKALYCFPCLIFKQNKPISWTRSGMKDIGNLTKSANKHLRTEDHISAVIALNLLGKLHLDEVLNESMQISRYQHNLEVSKNREMLKHHIRAVLFLVTQGLALSDHDEKRSNSNRGNFIELVGEFAKFSGNEKVTQALQDESSMFTGLSPDIQDDIINCIHDHLLNEIRMRVQKSLCVTIIADETTCISNTSQLAISLRLVFDGKVYEHLIDVVNVSSDQISSVQDLATVIKNSLNNRVGVTPEINVIGQSYDGAANMAGRLCSVQTILKETWPQANFVPSYAHKWEHVARKVCENIQEVSLFFGFIQNLCNFFRASPERTCLLSDIFPGSCPTRWFSKGKSVLTVENKFVEIENILQDITSNSGTYDSSTKAEAIGLLLQMRQVTNIFLLKVFKRILGLSDFITSLLQGKNIGAATLAIKIKDYQKHLDEIRSEKTFKEIMSLVKYYDLQMPQSCQVSSRLNNGTNYNQSIKSELEINIDYHQKLRSELEADIDYRHQTIKSEPGMAGVEETLKVLLYEIVDILQAELLTRFTDIERFQWMQLLHPENFQRMQSDPMRVRLLISNLQSAYPLLVPDSESFFCQLRILYGHQVREAMKSVSDFATLLQMMHSLDLTEALPDVSRALVYCLSLAITSISCERSFSVLRRIKNYCRSTIGSERTKHLMLLAVEYDLVKELSKDIGFCDKITDMFATMKSRRINLIYKK